MIPAPRPPATHYLKCFEQAGPESDLPELGVVFENECFEDPPAVLKIIEIMCCRILPSCYGSRPVMPGMTLSRMRHLV